MTTLEFFGLLFLAGLILTFFPFIIAAIAVAFCLLMALLCWIKERIISLWKPK